MADEKIYLLDTKDELADTDNIPLDFAGNPGRAKKTNIAALRDKIAPVNAEIELEDGATTTWDYSQGNLAVWTIGGNNTLELTGVTGVCSGQLKIIQDSTGGWVPSLPGNVETGSKFSSNPGGYDYIGFIHDSSGFSWKPINFGDTSASLGKPSLSVTQNDPGADLVSSLVTDATGYKFERATDSAFTTGVTTIQDTSSVTANDAGPLTVGVPYYYRVTAHASGFISNKSTIKSLIPEAPSFLMLTTFTAANGTAVTGITPDIGSGSWVERYTGSGGGITEVQSNQMQIAATGISTITMYNIGVDHYKLTAHFTMDPSITTSEAIIFLVKWAQGATLGDDSGYGVSLFKNQVSLNNYAGAFSLENSPVSIALADGVEKLVVVTITGDQIKLEIDGTTIFNYTTAVSKTGPWMGVEFLNSAGMAPGKLKINDIKVEGL